jgi:predicted alpha/beta superfamily hydrolase
MGATIRRGMLLGPLVALALAFQASPSAAASAEAPGLPVMAPATLAMADQFDLTSKITGRTYRIYISRPAGPAPAGGYPVLYLLDAYTAFPIAAAQVLLASGGGPSPAVVVGIGYPDTVDTGIARNRDLTPWPADPGSTTPGGKADDYGGADAFHAFMMEELRPIIARTYPVDPRNQALVGYSLGGLFTLHVMFHHPEAYRTYVAGSPSIWFDARKVLQSEAAFSDAVRKGKASPRLLITSGGWEQAEDSPELPPSGEARARAMAQMNAAGMVDNARALAARLQALKGATGYQVRYVVFPQETHRTGIPASTSRAVAFVLAP